MQRDIDKVERHDANQHMAPTRRRKSTLIALVIAGVLLSALVAFNYLLKPAMIKSFLAKAAPPPSTISTEVARAENWVPRLPSVGSLTAFQGIDVTTQIAGIVSEVTFDSGQDVLAGAKLVVLDSAVEQADLANNRAALKQAELDLARQNDLSTRAYASQSTQQAAQAKRDGSAATVQRTAALITQKTIVAPFAGRLGIRKIELGQYIAPGTSMVTLQALDPIRVDFPVPEQELSKLKVGRAVEVTVDSFPGQVFKGEIESLDARVNLDTRTLLVRARLKNPDKKLLPGMFANVAVLEDAPSARVTVPLTAISYSLFGDSIFAIKPEANPPAGQQPADIVERRFVRVGESRGDRVSVTEGISAGDQIVTSGQIKLQNGARVKVDNSAPLTPQPVRPKM